MWLSIKAQRFDGFCQGLESLECIDLAVGVHLHRGDPLLQIHVCLQSQDKGEVQQC